MKLFYLLAEKILIFLPPKETEYVREKQMLMHPGESGSKVTREYYIKKLGDAMFIAVVGVILSLGILIADWNNRQAMLGSSIPRNGYGEGDRRVRVNVYTDGEIYEKDKVITVEERQFSQKETEKVFRETREWIDRTVPGKNASLDHVVYDLVFPEAAVDYPVNIEWMTDNYDVLDTNGKIQEDFEDEKGEKVRISATLSYGAREEVYEFYALVFPRYREEKEQLTHDIDRMIDTYAKASISSNEQPLPKNVNGRSLSYEEALPMTWLYILSCGILSSVIVYMGRDRELKKKVEKREREMLLDYPEIVSKLTLLISAGLTLRAAFERVACDHAVCSHKRRSYAMEEMMITVHRMRSGISEYEAYLDFGKRCAVKRYTKLGALFSQNIKKGSAGLLQELEREVQDAFEERKANARRVGEEASTRLLLPMVMMLSVVMIVVIVPAFMSFSL